MDRIKQALDRARERKHRRSASNFIPDASSSDATSSVRRICVINSKGGCGKSTIATNLASYYAVNNYRTALLDLDPQGSSVRWLSLRDRHRASIHGINGSLRPRGMAPTFDIRFPDISGLEECLCHCRGDQS